MISAKSHIIIRNGFVGLCDINGNTVLKPEKYVLPVAPGGVMHSPRISFSEGVLPVALPNGKTGFVDVMGNPVCPFVFESAFCFAGGRSVVKSGGKWGMIDRQWNTKVPFRYDAIIYNGQETLAQERICAVSDGRFGYITPDGNNAIPFVFDNHIGKCSGEFSEGVASVVRDGKKFFIDRSGHTVIIPCEPFDYIAGFNHNYAMVIRYSDQHLVHGFIDKTGSLAVPVQYVQLPYGCTYSEGCMGVSFNGKLVYIDPTGKPVLETSYDYITDFSGGIAWGRKNGQWESFYRDGEIITSGCSYDWVAPCADRKWIVRINEKYGCIDSHGQQIFSLLSVPPNPFLDVSEIQWVFHCLSLDGKKTAAMESDFMK